MITTKSITGVMLLVIGMAAFQGCTDSPTSSDDTQATLTMEAELASTLVTSSNTQKNSSLATGDDCDSLKITRVRVLISRLKLHLDGTDDDGCTCHREVKVGPFVLQIDASGPKVFTYAVIPPGRYRKAKLELHRFSSSDISRYLGDSIFRDFVTDGRYTVIVEGLVYVNGEPTLFEYSSDITANYNLNFEELFQCDAGSRNTLVIVIDAGKLFRHKNGYGVRDPRNSKHHKDIDDAMGDCFKIKKRKL